MKSTQISRFDDIIPIILYGENELKIDINQFGLSDEIYNNDITLINKDYLDLIKTNYLQIDGVEFKFTDIKWDFSSKKQEGKQRQNYVFNFENIHQTNDFFVTVVKLYLLSKLLENGLHWSSMYSNIRVLIRFILKIHSEMHNTFNDITLEIIRDFFEDSRINYRTKVQYKSALNSFFCYYSSITGRIIDKSIFDYLLEVDNRTIKAVSQQGKRKLLPQPFVKSCKDLLYKAIFNEENGIKAGILQSYCLIYIAIQTGLRPSELLFLKKDCLSTHTVIGIELGYLHYKSTKNVHGGGFIEAKTIANAETIKVIQRLVLLNATDSNMLTPSISYSTLLSNFYRFIDNNAIELDVKSNVPLPEFEGKYIQTKDGFYINRPLITQFRVYFATELSQRGYSEYFISKLLNHRDEKMFNYYSRRVTSIQEDPNFSAIIVKDAIVNKYKILGPNGSVYEAKINEFIKNRDINVKEDLDKIIEDVISSIPIRKKLGGYCIKANP